MPELVAILWLPVAIALMAVTYVVTLGAMHARRMPAEEWIEEGR